MRLLHLDSSPLGAASASRRLTQAITDAWRQAAPGAQVTYRDVAANPPAHLAADALAARGTAPEDLTEAQKAEAEVTDTLLEEFLAADGVVIGAPMYNFAVPSQLKAWIDRVAQAGKTFRYTETGPVGLAGGKRVIIASTRGGLYSEGPAAGMDHQEAYLKTVFGFFGIDDVTFVRAEKLGMGEESRNAAIAGALEDIAALFRQAA